MFRRRISGNHGGVRLGCSSDLRYLIQVILTLVWGWNRAKLLRSLLKLWNICMALTNCMHCDCLQTLDILTQSKGIVYWMQKCHLLLKRQHFKMLTRIWWATVDMVFFPNSIVSKSKFSFYNIFDKVTSTFLK